MLLDQRKIKLLKSCMQNGDVIRTCALVAMNEDSYIDLCYKYDVYCDMSLCSINRAFRCHLFTNLKTEGLV